GGTRASRHATTSAKKPDARCAGRSRDREARRSAERCPGRRSRSAGILLRAAEETLEHVAGLRLQRIRRARLCVLERRARAVGGGLLLQDERLLRFVLELRALVSDRL